MALSHGIENDDKTKGRKEWHVLLLSLLLAFIIWLIHSLSLTYSVFLEYNVNLTSSLEGRARESFSDDVLIIRGKADGYYILRHRFSRRNVLDVTVNEDYVIKAVGDNDIFYIICEQVKGNIVDALGSAVELEFIVTESMQFDFARMTSKVVPVIPKTSIKFASQYMPMAEISIDPDTVEIFGEEDLLANIDSVWTENISYSRLDKTIQGVVNLVPIRHIEFAQSSVFYTLEISRYIEETVSVSVDVINVPEDKALIVLPTRVQLTCRRTFGGKPLRAEDVKLVVDYNDYIKGIGTELIPSLVEAPENAVYYQLSPRYVDCLLLESTNN